MGAECCRRSHSHAGSGAKDVSRDPPDIDFDELIPSENRFDRAMAMYNQTDFVGAFRVFALSLKKELRAPKKNRRNVRERIGC